MDVVHQYYARRLSLNEIHFGAVTHVEKRGNQIAAQHLKVNLHYDLESVSWICVVIVKYLYACFTITFRHSLTTVSVHLVILINISKKIHRVNKMHIHTYV